MKVVMVILLACAAVLVHGRPALEEEQQPQRNVTTYGQIFGHAYIGALNILRQWLSTTTEVPTTITTEVPTTTTTEVPTTTTTEVPTTTTTTEVPDRSFFWTMTDAASITTTLNTPVITDTTTTTTETPSTTASTTTTTETPSTTTSTADTTTTSTATTTTATTTTATTTTTTTTTATELPTTSTTTTTTTTTEPPTTTTPSTTTTPTTTTTTTTTTTDPPTTTTTTSEEPSTTTQAPTTTTMDTAPFILPTTSSDFRLKLLQKLKEEDEKAELAHLKTLQLEYDVMEGHISTPKASQSILEALGNVFKTVWPYLPLSILVLVIIASIVVHVRQKKRRQADFLHEDLDSVGVRNVEVVI